ncbi:radical SAM/SPASM domain-containing protein [Candidatus Omnitrophota bacterium]
MEVTNQCNLSCLMCPASKRMKRPKGFMNGELFRAIIDTNPDLEFVFLFQWGEPFLHPKIFELTKYVSAKGIRTMITTNGTIFSDEIIEQILDCGLERLTFSIDGVASTYTRIRGFDYDKLKANISKLREFRDFKKSNLKIDISMVVFEETEGDRDRLIQEWRDIADSIQFIPRLIPGVRKSRCRELWRGNLTVLWDGKVVPCCVDFDGKMITGDATKDDISQIWNGQDMRRLRILHGQKMFTDACKQCSEYKSAVTSTRFN